MMNLRKSWVNVSLLKLIIKNNLFPAKISLIIFTAVYLLSLLVINSDFNVICLIVFAFSAVILTFIYPCYLQSYLVDKNKSALIVSLPLDTKTVWLTNYLAGYLIALVTLLLEGIMLVIMMFVLKLDYIPNNLYLRFLLTIIILLFIYYTITFLVCCMSGKRLGQVAFSIMFYCMPLILIAGFTYISPRLVPMTIEREIAATICMEKIGMIRNITVFTNFLCFSSTPGFTAISSPATMPSAGISIAGDACEACTSIPLRVMLSSRMLFR